MKELHAFKAGDKVVFYSGDYPREGVIATAWPSGHLDIEYGLSYSESGDFKRYALIPDVDPEESKVVLIDRFMGLNSPYFIEYCRQKGG